MIPLNKQMHKQLDKTKNNKAKQYDHCYQYTVEMYQFSWKYTILIENMDTCTVFRGYDTV